VQSPAEIFIWVSSPLYSDDSLVVTHENGRGTVFVYNASLSFWQRQRLEYAKHGIGSFIAFPGSLFFLFILAILAGKAFEVFHELTVKPRRK
jgi:hypothetical protein